MQPISVFIDIANFADFLRGTANVTRTQGVCHHMILIFLDLL